MNWVFAKGVPLIRYASRTLFPSVIATPPAASMANKVAAGIVLSPVAGEPFVDCVFELVVFCVVVVLVVVC